MAYEFGLTNYFLHELGENLYDEGVVIENENKAFNNILNDKERIKREINKIKKKTNKYNDILNISYPDIKEIIVCIDLLLEIEISFKTSFIIIASNILNNKEISKVLDSEFDSFEDTVKNTDILFKKTINEYLDDICT